MAHCISVENIGEDNYNILWERLYIGKTAGINVNHLLLLLRNLLNETIANHLYFIYLNQYNFLFALVFVWIYLIIGSRKVKQWNIFASLNTCVYDMSGHIGHICLD